MNWYARPEHCLCVQEDVDCSQIECGSDGESLAQRDSPSGQDIQGYHTEEENRRAVDRLAIRVEAARRRVEEYFRQREEYFQRRSRRLDPPDSHASQDDRPGSSKENNTSADHSSGNREGAQAKSTAGDNVTSHQ